MNFGGMYTKRYLRKFVKLNGTSRKQFQLGKSKELSNTEESIDDTDVEEAQPDLATGVFCVIRTKELDFQSRQICGHPVEYRSLGNRGKSEN